MPAEFIGVLPAAPARSGEAAGRHQARRRREILLAYGLMLPAFAFVLGLLAYPVAWQGWTSLTNRSALLDGPPAFVGLHNYLRLLSDPEYQKAAAHTAAYFGITTVAKLIVGVALALLLARPFPGRTLAFLAVFLPWAYPAGWWLVRAGLRGLGNLTTGLLDFGRVSWE